MRIALCGYGYYGRCIAKLLENHRIVAICEPNLIAARAAKESFPSAKLVTDISHLTSDGLDVVWECGDLLSRKYVYRWAVEKRIPIVIEKPLALKESDLASFNGDKFTVNFREIYHPVLNTTREFLLSEEVQIKGISFFRSNTIAAEKTESPDYRTAVTGGSLLDKGIHDIANLSLCIAPAKTNSVKEIQVLNNVLSTSCCKIDPHAHGLISENFNFDLYSDIKFIYETPTQSFPVRLITSWIGIEQHQIDVPYPAIVQQAFWRSNLPATSYPFPCATGHCKLIVVEFKSPRGDGTLIGSTLRRPDCYPFLLVQRNNKQHQLFPQKNRVRNINISICDKVIQQACSANKVHTNQIINVHRKVFQLRQAVVCT